MDNIANDKMIAIVMPKVKTKKHPITPPNIRKPTPAL